MKLVRQPTPYSCAACCVAMITGVPLEMIFSDLGHDGSERCFRFVEYAAVLNRYGFHLGAYSDSELCGRQRLIAFSWTSRIPALVIVGSRVGKEQTHAIYWDGKRCWDPSGAVQPLESYQIREWWPLIQFKG